MVKFAKLQFLRQEKPGRAMQRQRLVRRPLTEKIFAGRVKNDSLVFVAVRLQLVQMNGVKNLVCPLEKFIIEKQVLSLS